MKKYICRKTVMAEPMTLLEAKERFGTVRYDGDETDGYLVVYDNGYESWSPKSVFKAGYIPEWANLIEPVKKIPVTDIHIIVDELGTPEKPYYSIMFKDLRDGEIHIGFSSYDLELVYKWKNESFILLKEKYYDED